MEPSNDERSVVVCYADREVAPAPGLLAVDRACFSVHGQTDFEAELAKPFSHLWIAKQLKTDDVVGYLLTWHVADELHILNVATAPAFRRRNVGWTLLQHGLEYARENHVRLILLEVRRGNVPAISLYRRAGFGVSGLRRGYYTDNKEDAVEMMLVLDPESGAVQPFEDEVRLEITDD